MVPGTRRPASRWLRPTWKGPRFRGAILSTHSQLERGVPSAPGGMPAERSGHWGAILHSRRRVRQYGDLALLCHEEHSAGGPQRLRTGETACVVRTAHCLVRLHPFDPNGAYSIMSCMKRELQIGKPCLVGACASKRHRARHGPRYSATRSKQGPPRRRPEASDVALPRAPVAAPGCGSATLADLSSSH
jgi:hypothetical protein